MDAPRGPDPSGSSTRPRWPASGGRTGPWLTVLLAAGAVLALALLAQTVVNYRYVSNNLVLQEARRVATERVRNIERAVRLSRPAGDDGYQAVLMDVMGEASGEVAGLAIVRADGTPVATVGETATGAAAPAGRPRPGTPVRTAFEEVRLGGRDVLVGALPCRCGAPRRPGEAPAAGPESGRLSVEVSLYRDSLSAPYARVARNSLLSAAAALALLVSLALIGLRVGPYVRGKQLESQMDLARQVQRDLLPDPVVPMAGIDVAAECLPAWQVGGDFYDVVPLPGGRVSFALGDVSGHGISAALLMALIHGAMSNPPWGATDAEPGIAAARLNDLLLEESAGDRFASLFWCAYDPAAGVLRYLNAGHLPALRIRAHADGRWAPERLGDGGPVLGVIRAAAFAAVTVDARPGDLLVLFSDGIVEATNARDEPYGDDRLIEAVAGVRDRPARVVCEAVLASLRAFTGDRPAEDDRTLLVVRLGEPPSGEGPSLSRGARWDESG